MLKWILALLLLFPVLGFSQEGTVPPLQVVPTVDLDRYLGTWYEIARLPNRFQTHCAGDVTATYSWRDDGDLLVINRCRTADGQTSEAEGRAKIADKSGPNSKLKVRFAPGFLTFLPFVWGDYWIIGLAEDYSYAVIGEPARRYLWVLSRTPTMDEGTLQSVLDIIGKQGYDLTNLLRTSQTDK